MSAAGASPFDFEKAKKILRKVEAERAGFMAKPRITEISINGEIYPVNKIGTYIEIKQHPASKVKAAKDKLTNGEKAGPAITTTVNRERVNLEEFIELCEKTVNGDKQTLDRLEEVALEKKGTEQLWTAAPHTDYTGIPESQIVPVILSMLVALEDCTLTGDEEELKKLGLTKDEPLGGRTTLMTFAERLLAAGQATTDSTGKKIKNLPKHHVKSLVTSLEKIAGCKIEYTVPKAV
jgi:hypothetical protein